MKAYNNISQIPARKYQGYIWDAGGKEPAEILTGDKLFDIAKHVPTSFIIEALLYSKDDKVAIHIRHSGKEHINEFDLNHLPEGSELHDVDYLPHRLKGVEKVSFRQLWIPEEDPLCEGMPVLKMKALIFTGFKLN